MATTMDRACFLLFLENPQQWLASAMNNVSDRRSGEIGFPLAVAARAVRL